MSISLKEVIEGAGYDFNDREDLYKIQSMLCEADEVAEEVDEKLEAIEEAEAEAEAEDY